MTFPFKTIICNKEHADAYEMFHEGTESVMSNSGGTTTSDPVVVGPGLKKRFMIIDETKLPKEEAERLLVKRAYNRECAERARKRSKETIKEFERQLKELQADKDELRSTVAAMGKQIQLLTEKNKALTLARLTYGVDAYSPGNIGRTSEIESSLKIHPPQQSLLALSSSSDENYYQNFGSMLSSWDYEKLLLLQQIRK